MKKIILLLALCLPLSAQVVEDFKCSAPISVTNANPAVVAFATPCGFNMRAFLVVHMAAAGNNGDTLNVDTTGTLTTYTFVASISNGTPNQILIGINAAATAWNLMNAINDTGLLKGQIYSSATVANQTFSAGASFQVTDVLLSYITPGTGGISHTVTTNAPTRVQPDTATTRMEWNVYITGATGCWAGVGGGCTSIGSDLLPKTFFARYVDPTHYSLFITQTVAFSTTGNGSFAGQNLFIQRANYAGALTSQRYPFAYQGESWSQTAILQSDGTYKVHLPGCPDISHELECSMAHRIPEQGQDQGNHSVMNTFTITSGVATVTFSPPYQSFPGGNANIALNGIIWPRNVTDTPDTWQHTLTAPNDTTTGTTLNHLVKYVLGTNNVVAVSKGDVGGAIGVCVSGCGTSGSATIADAGLISCKFANTPTAGHWAGLSVADDQCLDTGGNYLGGGGLGTASGEYITQPIGVVQANGAIGATVNIWWNGLNRGYVVQSMNGNPDGSNVTQITFNVPGYPDGDYKHTTQLPGVGGVEVGLAASIFTNYVISPYIYYTIFPYNYPMFPRMLKDWGSFDVATATHTSMWIKWQKSQLQCGNTGNDSTLMGSYFQPSGSQVGTQGQHYYHAVDPQMYAGQWMRYDYSRTPWHQVGTGSDPDYYNDLYWQGSFGGWHGAGHWFDKMGIFYLNLSGRTCPLTRNTSGQDILMTPVHITATSNEPEELIKTHVATWSPARFQGGDVPPTPTGTPGYEVYWGGITSLTDTAVTPITYEVRYSAAGSLKTLGFSNGLCKSGTTTCSGADQVSMPNSPQFYQTAAWSSSTLSQFPNIWIGIKPVSVGIASVTGSGVNPTWIVMRHDLNLTAGDKVTVASVGGNTAANVINTATSAILPRQLWARFDARPYPLNVSSYTNSGGLIKLTVTNHGLITGQTVQISGVTPTGVRGRYTLTVVDANSYTLDGSDYVTVCSPSCSGGVMRQTIPDVLNNIVSDGSTCTASLTIPHNIFPGWKIFVYGAPQANLSNTDSITATTYTVATTPPPTATSFSFACAGVTAGTYDTDNLINGGNFIIQSWPGIAIPVTGNGTYTSGGTIVSTEDNKNFTEIFLTPNPLGVPVTGLFGSPKLAGGAGIH